MPQQPQVDYDQIAAAVKGVDYDALAREVSAGQPTQAPSAPKSARDQMADSFGVLMRRKGFTPSESEQQSFERVLDGAGGGGVVTSAPAAAGQQGLKILNGLARRLYTGLLKPSKAVRQEFGDVGAGLLDKRRLITRGGAESAETAVEQAAKRADDMIANAPQPSQGVPANRVTSEFKDVLDAVKARVDAGVVDPSELDKVAQRVSRIQHTANASGGRIDPVRAQTLKRTSQDAAQGAYNQMQRGNAKMLSTDDLLDAATARGFKGGLEDIVPGIKAANKTTQGLIGESKALTEAVGRTSNHLPFGGVSDLAAMMAAHTNPLLGVAGKVSTMAGPGSAAAIGINEVGRLGGDEATARAMAIMASLFGQEDDQ